MQKFQLVLLIHAHQPVGNFDDVIERAYASSYLPFIDAVARHPHVRLGLHYSGPLLEWIERAHPEYFDRLRELIERRQVEMVGGGFYEPILVAIPPEDRHEQIERLATYLEKQFGERPRGAWLAERVWEPQIPSSLARAGVEYTLVDDNHFLGAGFELEKLYGYYLSEDLGRYVKVLPGLKSLRYLIPFREVHETIEFLRGAADSHPGGFAAMGDDLEKFGVWPGTHDHCYRDGWLDNFFSALEQCSDWLSLSMPGQSIASCAPLGQAHLPTASYTEMMEWSLPTVARFRYHDLVQEFSSRPEALPFIRGGIWRSFFTKYSEANLLHKKMLHVSGKVRGSNGSRRRTDTKINDRTEAMTLLLQGQCNDSYWHGVFGGLYSPHLRTAVWRSLARAEAIADRLAHRSAQYAKAVTLDFDGDGREEIYLTSDRYAALISPADGGTVAALDFRPPNVTLINSLMRRPETYHAKLRDSQAGRSEGVQSIHEQTRTKEDGLERWLHYDRWPRNAFRLLLFGRDRTYRHFAEIQLEENAALAGGPYRVTDPPTTSVSLVGEESSNWTAEKTLSFTPSQRGFDIVCDAVVTRQAPGAASINIALEVVLNFLAPATPDRYFESNGSRYPLRWAAAIPDTTLRVVDEWQKAAVRLDAASASGFWIAPIETVSESEDGFERIYQGSQILAVWPVELTTGAEWKGKLVLKAEQLD